MGWLRHDYHPANINCNHFKDFDTAVAHYESVKPIRGSNPPTRPIGGNRRYKWCEIRKPDQNTIQAALYDTPCVEYKSNGEVTLRLDRWATYTTAKFIDSVLPSKFGVTNLRKGRIILRTPDGREYHIPTGEQGITFKSCGWERLEPVEPIRAVEYAVDRKMMNHIRKPYRAFMDYLKVTATLCPQYSSDEILDFYPEVITQAVDMWKMECEECDKWNADNNGYTRYPHSHRNFSFSIRHVIEELAPKVREGLDTGISMGWRNTASTVPAKFANNILECLNMAKHGSPDDWRKLTLALVINTDCYANWYSNQGSQKHDIFPANGYPHHNDTPLIHFQVTAQTLLTHFDDLLKVVYADMVFVEVPVEEGKLPSRKNRKYLAAFNKLKDNLTYRQNVLSGY